MTMPLYSATVLCDLILVDMMSCADPQGSIQRYFDGVLNMVYTHEASSGVPRRGILFVIMLDTKLNNVIIILLCSCIGPVQIGMQVD